MDDLINRQAVLDALEIPYLKSEIDDDTYQIIRDMPTIAIPKDGDLISRQAILDEMGDINMDIYTDEVKEIVKNMPTVVILSENVIGLIRAEVEQVTYDMSEIDGEHFDEPYLVVDLKDVLEIIDKYMGVRE